VFRFDGLEVFQLALNLAQAVHRLSSGFPEVERFGLTANVRRAATSIVLNIAEGSGRGTRRDFARFIDIAVGSLFETTAAMLIGQRLGYLSASDLDQFR
jgi:four helix bundle protein